MSTLFRWFRDERGNDLIEYVLLAAFISIVSLATIQAIGPMVGNLYNIVAEKIEGKQGAAPPTPSNG